MVLKQEHKKAAAAILKEIHKKAMEIHGSNFKHKYKGEDAPGDEPVKEELEDIGGDPKHDLDAEENTDAGQHEPDEEDLKDGGDDEEEEHDKEKEPKGHPDLLMLRKLAKKNGK